MEHPSHWSDRTAACHDCACRESMPRIPRALIPRVPVDRDALLFRSGADLREDGEQSMNKSHLCNRDSFFYRGQVVQLGRDHVGSHRFID